ncbi:hypothetical protein FHS27_003044 [Rhodopirellula rubra]|uniref:Secreted protein n=1 Tax=Aporhodopirellula rubra TaxID=980271 RepID=A0A7W5DZ75_9BACT|nr:hypothetical protein [Aporhodopirellula rubra]
MNNRFRVLCVLTLLAPLLSTVGCGGSNEPVVATEGLSDTEIQDLQAEIDARYARGDEADEGGPDE